MSLTAVVIGIVTVQDGGILMVLDGFLRTSGSGLMVLSIISMGMDIGDRLFRLTEYDKNYRLEFGR